MMRLTTPGNLRLQQSRELSVNYGGSEANVAISVANFGGQVDYVTRLPENPLGEACIAELRSHNIGTDHILTGGKRLGTYYMEKAAAMRNSRVIYDREGSSFSELEPGMINWKEIFSDAGLFHWSGIDAALTPGLAEVCREAVETARKMGISVSYDINYRKNLWKYGKTAQEVLRPLITSSDIMFGSEGEYAMLFGLKAPGFKATSAADRYDTAAYEAFCGALLYAQSAWTDNQKRVDFSTAASVLKNTISGDYNMVKVSEVEELMARNEKGTSSHVSYFICA